MKLIQIIYLLDVSDMSCVRHSKKATENCYKKTYETGFVQVEKQNIKAVQISYLTAKQVAWYQTLSYKFAEINEQYYFSGKSIPNHVIPLIIADIGRIAFDLKAFAWRMNILSN